MNQGTIHIDLTPCFVDCLVWLFLFSLSGGIGAVLIGLFIWVLTANGWI